MRGVWMTAVGLAACLAMAVPENAAARAESGCRARSVADPAVVAPGETFDLIGAWGRSDYRRDVLFAGDTNFPQLEVLGWKPDHATVRVPLSTQPGAHAVVVTCYLPDGYYISSPRADIEVRVPDDWPSLELRTREVTIGGTLDLFGEWGPVQGGWAPTLAYAGNPTKQNALPVVWWTPTVVRILVPPYVWTTDAYVFVMDEARGRVTPWRDITILDSDKDFFPFAAQIMTPKESHVAPFWKTQRLDVYMAVAVLVLIGMLIFTPRGMYAAIPDFGLAGVFLITWIWPFTFGETTVRYLLYIVLLEFIVIHSSAFMFGVVASRGTLKQKLKTFAGFGGMYSLFAGGFSLAYGAWWPLIAFWGLTANKYLPLIFNPPGDDTKAVLLGRAPVAVIAYLGLTVATLFLPIPRLGITSDVVSAQDFQSSGEWIDRPWILMPLGLIYFTILGIYEMAVARGYKPSARMDTISPVS